MTLVAGSYERFLFGYSLQAGDTAEAANLQREFNYPAHKGAVKCIAAAASFLASGGADDLIHLYDIHGGRDLGFLMNPGDGAVTAIQFYTPRAAATPSHLLNGSADGSISVWAAPSWDCLKTLIGHRAEVTGLAVHPGGRMALSTSRDGELRMWNMAKGKCSFHTKLTAPAEAIVFSPSGAAYALICGSTVSLHATEGNGSMLQSLLHERKVTCVVYSGEGTLLTGSEDGSLRAWNTETGAIAALVAQAHSTRIRGLTLLPELRTGKSSGSAEAAAAAASQLPRRVATAASDGIIRLWDLQQATESGACEALAEVSTSGRLTCLAYVESPQEVQRAIKVAAAGRKRSKASRKAAQEEAAADGTQRKARPMPKGKRGEVPGGQKKSKISTPKAPAGAEAATEKEHVAIIEQTGVVHDGIVDFLDTPGAREAVAKSAKRKLRLSGGSSGRPDSGGSSKKLGTTSGRVGRPSPKGISIQSHKKRKPRS